MTAVVHPQTQATADRWSSYAPTVAATSEVASLPASARAASLPASASSSHRAASSGTALSRRSGVAGPGQRCTRAASASSRPGLARSGWGTQGQPQLGVGPVCRRREGAHRAGRRRQRAVVVVRRQAGQLRAVQSGSPICCRVCSHSGGRSVASAGSCSAQRCSACASSRSLPGAASVCAARGRPAGPAGAARPAPARVLPAPAAAPGAAQRPGGPGRGACGPARDLQAGGQCRRCGVGRRSPAQARRGQR